MTQEALYDALSEIFRDVFMRDVALRPELTAYDVLGWDSFKQIEIILAIEERYGVKFRTKDLDALQNVGDLVRVLSGKINA